MTGWRERDFSRRPDRNGETDVSRIYSGWRNHTPVNIFYTVSLVIERLNIIFATTFDKYEK
jgi:hypothetical protein